jgi:ferredoxin
MTAETDRPRMHIDWTRCDGRGLCVELLPDLLVRDKWGYPLAAKGAPAARSDVVVPASRMEAALDAVDLCPVLALKLMPGARSA